MHFHTNTQQNRHWLQWDAQIHPQDCPFPFNVHHPHLTHPSLDRPHSPSKMASGSNHRVSTNLTEQISRRFQEGFPEKSRTCLHCFGLLCNVPNLLHLMEHVMMSSNQHSSLCYSTNYNVSYILYTALLNVQ